MRIYLSFFILLVLCTGAGATDKNRKNISAKATADELKLYALVMAYRKANNLPPIPLSKSLTYVAQQHCRDLIINRPAEQPGGCNAHSWSDKGPWTACCYTADHKQATCMWNKPGELTNYDNSGYEIACGSGDTLYVMTPASALEGWKSSYHHNNVILNMDMWKRHEWKAIGVGMYKSFAVIWFGESEDKEGGPTE